MKESRPNTSQRIISKPKLPPLLFGGLLLSAFFMSIGSAFADKRIAYIHGNVASDGTLASNVTLPDTPDDPYDQMLILGSGSEGDTGMSDFRLLIEGIGYTITQHYDQETTLDQDFLTQFDAIVFGLHQKIWSLDEQTALDTWIKNGGGILMYSDSAAGGSFREVGIRNNTGQNATNSILTKYGIQISTDQAQGVRGYRANSANTNPIVADQLVLEGEGISPVAVDPDSSAQVLIPLEEANKVNGSTFTITNSGVTGIEDENGVANPEWAVLALNQVGEGNVMAIFDRQPFWNDGVGSNIREADNAELLLRIVRYIARDYGNSTEWADMEIVSSDPSDFQVSYRQWNGGTGQNGFDYIARNNIFSIEQQPGLSINAWRIESELIEDVSSTLETVNLLDGATINDTEITTVRILPDGNADRWFARLAIIPNTNASVEAGRDHFITTAVSASITSTVSNASSQTWSMLSGPGNVTFADPTALNTTATFSSEGTYVLQITANDATPSVSDTLTVSVFSPTSIVAAINSGGAAYNGQNGINYIADQFFSGGSVDAFSREVANTEDDTLYNFARSGGDFSGYSITVPNGNYLVLFHLSETFFTAPNRRVFDVSLEGNLILDDIDLFSVANARSSALEQSFITNVADGVLNIDVSATINNPLINGIVVVAQP